MDESKQDIAMPTLPPPPQSREVWRAPLVRGDSTVSARDSTYWLSVASSSASASAGAASHVWSFASTAPSLPLLSAPQSTAVPSAAGDLLIPTTVTTRLRPAPAPMQLRRMNTTIGATTAAGRVRLSTSPLQCSDTGGYVLPFQLVPSPASSTTSSASSSLSPSVRISPCSTTDEHTDAVIDTVRVNHTATTAAAAPPPPLAILAPSIPDTTAAPLQQLQQLWRSSDASPIAIDEVVENQRYQIVLGWGSKGHLLPLDPHKYMQAIRTPRRVAGHAQQQHRRRRSLEHAAAVAIDALLLRSSERHSDPVVGEVGDEDDNDDVEWRHTATFPDVALPPSSDATQRWVWLSPWHLALPSSFSPVDPDGWQYATSFQHLQQSVCRSSLVPHPSVAWINRPKHYVRCRKWIRYRQLCPFEAPSPVAFDDAFLDTTSGWLRKLGHVRQNWKARFFVLTKSILRYYTDESRSKLRGEVLLFHPATRTHFVDIRVATGSKDAAFAVHVGSNYALLLQAASIYERERWLYAIEDVLLCRDSYFGVVEGREGREGREGDPARVDVRACIALRRQLSAELLALDAGKRTQNDQARDDLLVLVDTNAVLRRVCSDDSKRLAIVLQLLTASDAFLATKQIESTLEAFVETFQATFNGSTAASTAAPIDRSRDALLPTVAVLTDPHCLAAFERYRLFLESLLGTTMRHLQHLPLVTGSPITSPRGWNAARLASLNNSSQSPTAADAATRLPDDAWLFLRRAVLSKLERLLFLPLHATLYDLVDASIRPLDLAAFERNRLFLSRQPPTFLDVPQALVSPTKWREATLLLSTIDNYSLPHAKAAVLLQVARCIYAEAPSSSSSTTTQMLAADDFLPIFIWILTRAALRNVIATRHIVSETMVAALMVGETGYYATMLEAAVGFIAAFEVPEAIETGAQEQ